MHFTIKLGRPDMRQQQASSDVPIQDLTAPDQGPAARLRQRLVPMRTCRTPIVTRVLHEGEEMPKEKSLQWLVTEIMSKSALHEGGDPSRDVSGNDITEGQSSSSTLTLHVECGGSGKRYLQADIAPLRCGLGCRLVRSHADTFGIPPWSLQAISREQHLRCVSASPSYFVQAGEQGQALQAFGFTHAGERTPRSPSSASSQPLSAMARHYANMYFDAYWRRTPDGAPCRYTDADCWHPGVLAAVISTMTQLRQQGTSVDSAPILAFMQE